MKRTILFASILAATITASARTSDATLATPTEPFAQTRIGVPACVHFVQGDEFAISILADDADDLDRLSWSVTGGVLTFSLDGELAWGDDLAYDITIVSPATPEVKPAAAYEVASFTPAENNPSLALAD